MIIPTSSVQTHLGWAVWRRETRKNGRVHRRDFADTAHNLLECMCHFLDFLIRFSFSWRGRRLKLRSHDAATDNTGRPMPIHAPVYFCLSTSIDGILEGTTAPVGHAFPFVHKCTHPTSTAWLYPRGGIVGERSQFYATSFTQKRGARHGSMICCPMPESTLMTRQCGSCMHPLFSMAPTYGLLPNLFVLSSIENTQPTPHPLLNNTTPEEAFLVKNFDKNTRRADPDLRGSSALPPTHPWRRPPTSSGPWAWHAPEDRRRRCARASPEAKGGDLTAALAMSLWESETRQ
jgi:hypothetical protein